MKQNAKNVLCRNYIVYLVWSGNIVFDIDHINVHMQTMLQWPLKQLRSKIAVVKANLLLIAFLAVVFAVLSLYKCKINKLLTNDLFTQPRPMSPHLLYNHAVDLHCTGCLLRCHERKEKRQDCPPKGSIVLTLGAQWSSGLHIIRPFLFILKRTNSES